MLYTLDTNVWVTVLRGNVKWETLESRVGVNDLAIVEMVRAELFFGARISAKPDENLAKVCAFLEPFRSLVFDETAAERYGEIRSHLQRQGTPIGPEDLVIAATALAFEATVVTNNVREFSRIPGLLVEDWT